MQIVNRNNVGIMLGWVISFELVGYLLGRITQASIATWYPTLYKSALNPPAIVFAIVWTILYMMLALAGWSLWQHRQQFKAKVALILYAVQMVLNWAWSPLFFYFHHIQLSLYCLISITFLTLAIIFLTKDDFKFSSIMLLPYLIWLIFATYLNGVIYISN